ncbi:MAG: helicase-related protein [Pseudanabaena sp.]
MDLDELALGMVLRGVLPDRTVTIISISRYGTEAVDITYKDSLGALGNELLYRDRESELEIVQVGHPWSFDGDGALLRLVSEAYRIHLAHLFDPLLAVHTSLVEPLPHQITAVYGEMLSRQPLRFLLADDPGAGKTIMAGLLIRELLMRGDLHRCLIVCPGSLATQWQDELSTKFHLPFEILSNDRIETSRTGNALAEMPLVIARLDKLSRNDDLQAKLAQTDWDLVVCDEAHKMSASFFGGEVKETKRYKLGKQLSQVARHFLLMTATPHNGREEDFQLFMALLDGDRFEGKFREGVHASDVSDLIRRLVKEDMLKFDGKPLFPERRAYTVSYQLSVLEESLYRQVTDYVRDEFNRADALENEGRKGTVGFALAILQRRLASSPEPIYQSIKRRRERLQKRLQEEELRRQYPSIVLSKLDAVDRDIDPDDLENDMEDFAADEREMTEEELVDLASASQTISELQAEIAKLKELEELAARVRRSGTDRKWEELSGLLQDCTEMFDAGGYRRKLVIFTEHRDTLNYLVDRVSTLLGRTDAVVTIHGAIGREERKKAEHAFKQDVAVQVLIATDAAGEGINLQRSHLMVNYDLPWNPNRLEQRFGRIHRIGQTEVCHLWNLVAAETREGSVYATLLKKIEAEQEALGGKVFDVLGKAIAGAELRDLMIRAIRYGDRPDIREKLNQAVVDKLDQQRLRDLLEERALAHDSMDASRLQRIREDMERMEARKLQPHFIAEFFLRAFTDLGGSIRQREPHRYEITHVPASIRNRSQQVGLGEPVGRSYERICFAKDLINVSGKPIATFVCPGHPLLNSVISLLMEQNRDLLKQGAVLVDETSTNQHPRVLVYLEHSIQDARTNADGSRRVVSRRMHYVEIDAEGHTQDAGYAPYLDYRPLREDEQSQMPTLLAQYTFSQEIESKAIGYAIAHLVPQHFAEIRDRREKLIDKTIAAVKERLAKEISHWDRRANELSAQELAGKPNAKLNSARARQRADDLEARMKKRLDELAQERQLTRLPPIVVGSALIIPASVFTPPSIVEKESVNDRADYEARRRVELRAMAAVMAQEVQLGFKPVDVSDRRCGYDIESYVGDGRLRLLEVKGRVEGADTVTVTKNEILVALNKPESYLLAMVKVPQDEDALCAVRYVQQPFQREPDFGSISVNYSWQELWAKGQELTGWQH